MSKMIPAGIVTSYGAAVRGGYQGTYEEFCAALGGLTKVLEDFEGFQVEVTTLEPGEPATADYSDGVLTLGIPAGETGNGIQSAELNQNYTLTLTWTNGQSTTVGPIRGATGQTPNLTIGTVETLDPDESATATITGTPEDPVLNLGIPKGESGGGDAGDITFDPEEDYDEGTVGKALKDELNAIDQKADKTTYVTLSGTTVTQTGADNTMYLCGELATLSFTAPATGITAIRFTSGSTPTVLSFSGVSLWLNGFDPTSISADTMYELNILNGVGVASWT